MTYQADFAANVARRKLYDRCSRFWDLLSTFIGLITLTALILDLAVDGGGPA